MDFRLFGCGYCVRCWVLRNYFGLEYEVQIRRGGESNLREEVGVSCESFVKSGHDSMMSNVPR